MKTPGRDYITYTADRKIGKTHNLIRLAIKYDYPMIVHDSRWARFIKQTAKKETGKDICVLSYRTVDKTMDGMRCDVVLKDEMVPIETLRHLLDGAGKRWVRIVGIN